MPDQAVNAANVHAAGAGLVLRPEEGTADAVADRVRALLTESRFAEQAGRLQQEVDAMPGPVETVPVLRALASGP